MLDANLLRKGEKSDELPETYVAFITEHDVIGKGRPLYHIGRYIFDTNERFDDGSHILYVNGEYRDETPVGKLMHDFPAQSRMICTMANWQDGLDFSKKVRKVFQSSVERWKICVTKH